MFTKDQGQSIQLDTGIISCLFFILDFIFPIFRWYPLKSKPGHEGKKNKHRGEIEVKVAFTVKSGSLLDLSKKEKHKGSLSHLSQAAHNIGKHLLNALNCMLLPVCYVPVSTRKTR